MDLALGALVITLFLLPGAVFVKAYLSDFITKDKTIHVTWSELLFRGLFYSLVIHYTAVRLVIPNFFHRQVDFHLIYHIIVADKIELDDQSFSSELLSFLYYTLFSSAASFIVAKIFRNVCRLKNWDVNVESLRNANFWYLVFNGREYGKKGDFTWVDVLTKQNILYSGFLLSFEYSPNKDALEAVMIDQASRRSFSNTAVAADREDRLADGHAIPGDMLVILGSEITNINIQIIELIPPKHDDGTVADGGEDESPEADTLGEVDTDVEPGTASSFLG